MLTLYYLSSQPSWGLEGSLLLVISENRCKGECTPGKQWQASIEIWVQENQRGRAVRASMLLTHTCLWNQTEWREYGEAFWSILTSRKLFAKLFAIFKAVNNLLSNGSVSVGVCRGGVRGEICQGRGPTYVSTRKVKSKVWDWKKHGYLHRPAPFPNSYIPPDLGNSSVPGRNMEGDTD